MTTANAYERAKSLFDRGAIDQAFDACRAAMMDDKADGRPFLLAARMSSMRGQLRHASEYAAEAARRSPNDALAQAYSAKCLVAMNDLPQARAAAQRAFALGGSDAATWDLLGFVLSRTNQLDRAREAFQHAVRLAPQKPGYWLNLGAALAVLGDIQGAIRAYETCIERDPDFTPAYLSLVNLRPATPDRNFVAKLEQLLSKMKDDSSEAAQIGYAVARSLEELGEYERALGAYARAKRSIKAEAKFSIERERATFAAAAATAVRGSVSSGHTSAAPIFVVGMPRSGTTLVERIVSAHPDVASAGELHIFPSLVQQILSAPGFSAAVFEAVANANLAALGRAYESAARARIGSNEPKFVDKLPLNFLCAGLINRALPNARIVCLRRDPMDTIIGNYRQFLSGAYDYSYDLEDTARYFILFDKLVAHWRDTLPPDRFTEVVYEDLVADPEQETRKLIAFCDLSWNDACLAPHENAAPIATLSSAQVREPINAKSIGRWRRYGPGLDPARQILVQAGLIS